MTELLLLPTPGEGNRIFAKLEYQNPTGSHYDRIYPSLLDNLEEQGKIVRGLSTLVETTSGNAGIAFANVCRSRGYKCIVFAPSGLPQTRLNLITREGAELHLTSEKEYVAGAARAMREFLVSRPEKFNGVRLFYSPNHSQTSISCESLESIAEESIFQSGHSFDCFVGAAGNGSTLTGIGKSLKKANPSTYIIAFDPDEAPVATSIKMGSHLSPSLHAMYGAGAWGVRFPHLEYAIASLVDEVQIVTRLHWGFAQFVLVGFEQWVGPTSAAAYYVASEYCRQHSGKNVLIIFYDKADRY
jgi:cysteine synthase A